MIKRHLLKTTFIFLLYLVSNPLIFSQNTGKVIKLSQATIILAQPAPVYLNDYISDITKKLKINLTFSDPDVSTWNVHLKIIFQRDDIILRTKQNFRPFNPITLTSGVHKQVSGSDLYEYLDYNNLDISGISREQLEQTGGMLPEGTYNLSVEVYDYDYRPDMLLSSPAFTQINISLFESPTLISPLQESVVNPNKIQNLTFQWQLPFSNPLTTRYKLHLYEITDPNADPKNSIEDGSALKIFSSEEVSATTYLYDVTKPLLEEGKKYAFRVEAINTEEKPVFKNKGFSEIRWFCYGYPKNGIIKLESPVENHTYTLREDRIFKWSAPDNILNNQQYNYELKIFEVKENEIYTEVVNYAQPVYTYRSNILTGHFSHEKLIQQQFLPLKKYAWQVKAYTEQIEIAKSDIYTFDGPLPFETFKAGNHIVELVKANNTDLSSFSGIAKVKVNATEKIEAHFENIRLEKIATEWVLQEGEIKAETNGFTIKLTPEYAPNGEAEFICDELLLTKNMLSLHGIVKWNLPYPTTSTEIATVESVPLWFNYNELKLLGVAQISEKTRSFDLLDPFGFTIELSEQSNFLVRGKNNFVLRAEGNILFPKSIKSTNSKRQYIPFKENQLFWIEGTNPAIDIVPIKNIGIVLKPFTYVFDFSEESSPGKLKDDPSWKGCYFREFETNYYKYFENSDQVKLKNDISFKTNQETNDSVKFWISTTGLEYKYKYDFADEINSTFNTFPSVLKALNVCIEESKTKNSKIHGSIKIPFLSETDNYNYTVEISDNGCKRGDLDKSLDGTEFTFNPDGGDQKINLLIKRAVFSDRERLDLTLDFDWPALGIKLESIDNFKIWGNYKIGFGKPNGTSALTTQHSGKIKSFPITAELIGAGSSAGVYAMGIAASVIMADDITGPDGPPKSNIYSFVKNKFLEQVITEDTNDQPNSETTTSQEPQSGTGLNFDDIPDGYTFDEIESLIAKEIADRKKTVMDQINSTYTRTVESGFEEDKWAYKDSVHIKSGNSEFDFVTTVKANYSPEALEKALTTLYQFLPKDQQEKAMQVNKVILALEQHYQIDIFKEITDINNLINKILKKEYDKLLNDLLKPIEGKKVEAQAFVTNSLKTLTDSVNKVVKNLVDVPMNLMSQSVQGMTDNKDIKDLIKGTAESIKITVTNEINSRINAFVKERVTDPINNQLIGEITSIVQDSLRAQLTRFGYSIIDNGINAKPGNLVDVNSIISSINQEVFAKLFDFNQIQQGIEGARQAFFEKYFKPDDIFDKLVEKLATQGANYVAGEVSKALINTAVNSFGKGAGEVVSCVLENIGDNVKLDFSNLDEKIKNGQLDKILVFDLSKIKITTPVVDISGSVKFGADEVYGDAFRGNLEVLLKLPTKFKINAKYINGRKDDLAFWYIGVGMEAKDDSIKKAKDESAKEEVAEENSDNKYEQLPAYVPLGIVNLKGINGKVYHHMKVNGENTTPDASLDYGASLALLVCDGMTNGKHMTMDLSAAVELMTDGNYTIYFKGGLVVGKSSPKSTPVGQGSIEISYNSREQHFLGLGEVHIKNEALCADGTVVVDLMPDKFLIGIGSETKKIVFIPGCNGWSPTGWLELTEKKVDLGLGLSFSAYAQSPEIEFMWTKFAGYAEFGFIGGIQVVVIYSPSVSLEKAGILVEAYAAVGLLINGSKNPVLSGTLKGNLTATFQPVPVTASGSLHTELTLLGVLTVGFDMGFSTTFN